MAATASPHAVARPSADAFLNLIPDQLREAITSIFPGDEAEKAISSIEVPQIPKTPLKACEDPLTRNCVQAMESILLRTLTANRETIGLEHADTQRVMHTLAMVQVELGHVGKAEETYRSLFETQQRIHGPDASWAVMNNLGVVLNKNGRYVEAEELFRRLLPLLQKSRLGPDSPQALGCLRHLMEAIGGQARYSEAREMNTAGFELARNMGGEHQPDELKAMQDVAVRLEEAERHRKQGVTPNF